MNAPGVIQLLRIIEQQLDWGDTSTWQSKDFENLNELIFEKTKVSLSASTLRRVWGRVEYNHYPSVTTLDTLAKFAGYENWRNFTKQIHINSAPPNESENLPIKRPLVKAGKNLRLVITLLIVGVILISLAAMFVKKTVPWAAKVSFSFNIRPVTRTIPNSVIFNYDVKTNPGDSVFIQQSWDNTTRVAVDKNKHQYTSIYYRPGFYHAKLLVNDKIVKEQMLMIPTDGWLGLIAQEPVPVYLDNKEYLGDSLMQLPVSAISQKKIALVPQPPVTEYYNVGNFTPVSLKNFSFTTYVKSGYRDGAAACQYLSIILFTDNTPVSIDLSAKGCVSNLRLLNGRFFISGKDHDLSGFGADLSQWVKFSCRSVPGKIQYYVNDKLAYESELPLYNEDIIGLGYNFQGTGSVKGIRLASKEKEVFKAF